MKSRRRHWSPLTLSSGPDVSSGRSRLPGGSARDSISFQVKTPAHPPPLAFVPAARLSVWRYASSAPPCRPLLPRVSPRREGIGYGGGRWPFEVDFAMQCPWHNVKKATMLSGMLTTVSLPRFRRPYVLPPPSRAALAISCRYTAAYVTAAYAPALRPCQVR